MNDRKEKLQKELEHLEKAHKAGIIDDSEYEKSKARVDSKLADIEDQIRTSQEKNRVVSEILDSAKEAKVEIVDIPEDTYGVIVDEEPVRQEIHETAESAAEPESATQEPADEEDEVAIGKPTRGMIKEIDDDETGQAEDEDPDDPMDEDAVEQDDSEDDEDTRNVRGRGKSTESEDEFDEDTEDDESDRSRKSIIPKIKNRKLKKKKPVEEEREPFNWGPVVAIAAFLIIAGAVFIAIKSSTAPPELPADEPAFNTIDANDLRIQVEGVTLPIEVYTDYTCGPCKMTRENLKRLAQEYGKAIEIDYRNFPLSADLNASVAAECARKQSMFDSFADKLYSAPVSDPAILKGYAKDLGLNQDLFSACLENLETKDKVMADYLLGVQKGVKGTPTIFLHEKQVSGYKDYQQLKELVDFQLA